MLGAALAVGGAAAAQEPASRARYQDPPLVLADSARAAMLVAGRAVLAGVLASAGDTAPVCVSFADGGERYRPATADLRALADRGRRFVSRTECPKTYASMILVVDSLGRPVDRRPRGYVDPRYLELVLPVAWAGSGVRVAVRVAQGTGTDFYECELRRGPRDWIPSCERTGRAVSRGATDGPGSRGRNLTFVATDGATGIRLCAWTHPSTVNITAPLYRALRS